MGTGVARPFEAVPGCEEDHSTLHAPPKVVPGWEAPDPNDRLLDQFQFLALATACMRLRTPAYGRGCSGVFTVPTLTYSSCAIRRLDLPAATSWSISCSRPLKCSSSSPTGDTGRAVSRSSTTKSLLR